MSKRTVKERYKGNWKNVDESCQLCRMSKKTEWHLETKRWVIAEKLGGGPFVVSKRHQKELSDEEWDEMERIVGLLYDDFDIVVRMNLVKDHWHAHLILPDEENDLSGE